MEQATAVSVKERISVISPELQDRYLQEEWRLTGWQVVCSGFRNGDYVYEPLNKPQKRFAGEIVNLLGIGSLLRRNVQQLSTGELRKVLIARALVGKPAVLALDEACDGLDMISRKQMIETLERLARSGTQLLLTTHRSEEIIPSITHLLVLEKGRITASGPRETVSFPQASGRASTAFHSPSELRASPPRCSGSKTPTSSLNGRRSCTRSIGKSKATSIG
jgi:ABC-type molybdenum transport system ATPase subunit/photorepair protein PhrA